MEKPTILGYSLTDPSTDFTIPPHQIKNVSYYKRNWKSGAPLSSIPYWLDMDHIPPHKREFVLRPDLALGAMQAILGRIEKEELQELARRQALQETKPNSAPAPLAGGGGAKLGTTAPERYFCGTTFCA